MKKPKKTLRKPRLTDAKRSKKFAAERATVAAKVRVARFTEKAKREADMWKAVHRSEMGVDAVADRKQELDEQRQKGLAMAARLVEAAKADPSCQPPTEQAGDMQRAEPTLNEQTLNALRAVAEEAQRRKARQAEERQSNITIRHSALAGSSAAATLLAHVNRLSERGAIFAMSEELLSDGTVQIVVSETREIPVFFSPAFYALRDASTAYDIRMLNASGARGTPA